VRGDGGLEAARFITPPPKNIRAGMRAHHAYLVIAPTFYCR
jgi:hypothetical protein